MKQELAGPVLSKDRALSLTKNYLHRRKKLSARINSRLIADISESHTAISSDIARVASLIELTEASIPEDKRPANLEKWKGLVEQWHKTFLSKFPKKGEGHVVKRDGCKVRTSALQTATAQPAESTWIGGDLQVDNKDLFNKTGTERLKAVQKDYEEKAAKLKTDVDDIEKEVNALIAAKNRARLQRRVDKYNRAINELVAPLIKDLESFGFIDPVQEIKTNLVAFQQGLEPTFVAVNDDFTWALAEDLGDNDQIVVKKFDDIKKELKQLRDAALKQVNEAKINLRGAILSRTVDFENAVLDLHFVHRKFKVALEIMNFQADSLSPGTAMKPVLKSEIDEQRKQLLKPNPNTVIIKKYGSEKPLTLTGLLMQEPHYGDELPVEYNARAATEGEELAHCLKHVEALNEQIKRYESLNKGLESLDVSERIRNAKKAQIAVVQAEYKRAVNKEKRLHEKYLQTLKEMQRSIHQLNESASQYVDRLSDLQNRRKTLKEYGKIATDNITEIDALLRSIERDKRLQVTEGEKDILESSFKGLNVTLSGLHMKGSDQSLEAYLLVVDSLSADDLLVGSDPKATTLNVQIDRQIEHFNRTCEQIEQLLRTSGRVFRQTFNDQCHELATRFSTAAFDRLETDRVVFNYDLKIPVNKTPSFLATNFKFPVNIGELDDSSTLPISLVDKNDKKILLRLKNEAGLKSLNQEPDKVAFLRVFEEMVKELEDENAAMNAAVDVAKQTRAEAIRNFNKTLQEFSTKVPEIFVTRTQWKEMYDANDFTLPEGLRTLNYEQCERPTDTTDLQYIGIAVRDETGVQSLEHTILNKQQCVTPKFEAELQDIKRKRESLVEERRASIERQGGDMYIVEHEIEYGLSQACKEAELKESIKELDKLFDENQILRHTEELTARLPFEFRRLAADNVTLAKDLKSKMTDVLSRLTMDVKTRLRDRRQYTEAKRQDLPSCLQRTKTGIQLAEFEHRQYNDYKAKLEAYITLLDEELNVMEEGAKHDEAEQAAIDELQADIEAGSSRIQQLLSQQKAQAEQVLQASSNLQKLAFDKVAIRLTSETRFKVIKDELEVELHGKAYKLKKDMGLAQLSVGPLKVIGLKHVDGEEPIEVSILKTVKGADADILEHGDFLLKVQHDIVEAYRAKLSELTGEDSDDDESIVESGTDMDDSGSDLDNASLEDSSDDDSD